MRWHYHIGNAISGISIGAGLLIVAPDLTWAWFAAVCIIAFGTTFGNTISRQ